MKRRRIPYSEAELRFIEARRSMNREALHAAFVRSFCRADVLVDHIKSLCTRRGWTAGRSRWRSEEDALLRQLYPDTPTRDAARQIGRSLTSTYQRARTLGLEKSEAYLASPAACRLRRGDNVGAATRFKKGQTPPNKGLRRPGWSPGRMRETQFTKGQLPHNTKWAGHERLSKNGYIEISVEQTNPHTGFSRRYVLKHRWLWEQANGPVPRGFALKCLGDKRNTDPSNWELVPRALLPRLNGKSGRNYDHAPAELKPTILAVAKLEHAARTARSKERSA